MTQLIIPRRFYNYADDNEEYEYEITQKGIDVTLTIYDSFLVYRQFFAWGSKLINNNNNEVTIIGLLKKDNYNESYKPRFYVDVKETTDISIAKQMELLIKRRQIAPVESITIEQEKVAHDVAEIHQESGTKETEKERLVSARLGQGKYRSDLLTHWQGCAVTKCTDKALLVASHIKPWAESSNDERLDPYNGLLLIATLDKAFDRHLISFTDDGSILISSSFKDYKLAGIHEDMKINTHEAHAKYLEYHRQQFYRLQEEQK
ncbi:HNH endonuclease [Photobacterium leiognathi]|uniref:HNH endonuclease n=1 Tax=Photobacterium leiognathi TaxID=553611 RepID=UPI00298296AB|nr:HNH endonuclease [Photobacterium leiognathi]